MYVNDGIARNGKTTLLHRPTCIYENDGIRSDMEKLHNITITHL